MKLLQYRSEIALKEDVIDEDLLTIVSQIVVENQNMRHGIEIIRQSGLICDKKDLDRITPDVIRKAIDNVYPTFRKEIVFALKNQELLTLLGIVKSLINNDKPYALVDDAFEEYQFICENYSIESQAKRNFRKYVRQLNQLKIIASKTFRIEDTTRGRHLEVTVLDCPVVKLEELIDNILQLMQYYIGIIKKELNSTDRSVLFFLYRNIDSFNSYFPKIENAYKDYRQSEEFNVNPVEKSDFRLIVWKLYRKKLLDLNISSPENKYTRISNALKLLG